MQFFEGFLVVYYYPGPNSALCHQRHQGEAPHNPAQWVMKTPGTQGQGKS